MTRLFKEVSIRKGACYRKLVEVFYPPRRRFSRFFSSCRVARVLIRRRFRQGSVATVALGFPLAACFFFHALISFDFVAPWGPNKFHFAPPIQPPVPLPPLPPSFHLSPFVILARGIIEWPPPPLSHRPRFFSEPVECGGSAFNVQLSPVILVEPEHYPTMTNSNFGWNKISSCNLSRIECLDRSLRLRGDHAHVA